MWNIKRNYTNELPKQKETQRMKLWLPGEGMVRDFRKVMYTLLYLKWITKKDLLYSTWNSAKHYVPVQMGGDLGEDGYMYIYIYMAEFLHCSPETITGLLIS